MTDTFARLTDGLADRYRIERELGPGGMATVYLAQDLKHRRKVALKVLRPELAAIIGAERFLKEIEVTANLQHPHILPLYDSGEADGPSSTTSCRTSKGESLRDRLTREKQLGVERGGDARARGGRRRSSSPIATAWSIATSSRRTSCSRTVRRWWRTSGSRSPCPRPAAPG